MSFLFGGDTPQVKYNPNGASAGGLTTSVPAGGGNITTTPDANRTAAVGNVANTFGGLADQTAGLRSTVTPGYNALLGSQLDSINNSAHQAIGNLQQNLQSRRVLGSSFGQDTLSRAQAEFSKQRADTTANNFLTSLDTNNKLLQQEYQARTQQAQTGLNEMNLEAGVANGLIGGTNQILAQNAQTNAKLQSDSQAGAGKFLGSLVGQFGGSAAKGLGSLGSGLFGAGDAAAAAGMGTAADSAALLAELGPLSAI